MTGTVQRRSRLRELELDGMVQPEGIAEVPRRVEYKDDWQ
jgi:DNA-binding HxlR family transcriptional regulator